MKAGIIGFPGTLLLRIVLSMFSILK
jgi:hypothetical protein